MKIIAAPAFSTAVDDLVVALRAARLDQRGHARVERELRTVREREERVRGERRSLERVAELACFLDCDPNGIDAAHLSGPDPDRLQVLHEHDRVRGDVLAHPPGEEQVAPRRLVRAAGHDLHPLPVGDVPVPVLDEHPAEDALEVALRRLAATALEVVEDPDRLLPDERLERDLVVAGREQHLDELRRDQLPERRADGPVENDDASVRGDRIGGDRA